MMTLSWSALRSWEQCRQQDYLRQQGQRLKNQDIRHYFHGTAADRIMRAYLEDENRKPGDMLRKAEEIFSAEEIHAKESGDGVVRWQSDTDRAKTLKMVQRLVVLLEPILDEYVLPYDFHPEFRFRHIVKIPGLDGEPAEVALVGGIDILVRDHEGRMRHYDLKATKNVDYHRQVRGQLIFYDACVEMMYGAPGVDVAVIQPLIEERPVVRLQVEEDDRLKIMERMILMAHHRWRGDVEVAATSAPCFRCGVQHACPKFRVEARVIPSMDDLLGVEQ